ncbi:hypothetical protein ACQSM0_003929 [Enterobacter hormaechei]
MFNALRKNFTFKGPMAFAMASLLLSLSQTGWAGECRMNDGHGGTTTLINAEYSGGPIRLPPPGNDIGVYFNVNLTPGIQAQCGPGNDGYNLMSQQTRPCSWGAIISRACLKRIFPAFIIR